ncbi:hypothetical protein HETIRDRAFT_239899, partial [Heterobasidion irregulare TC 32-1]
IPDLHGKVAVVTGANSGIGYQTTAQLALHGAKVYLACRTESKALAAIARIEKENPILKGTENLIWTPLDLSSISSAKAAAEEILAKEQRLDLLVNNAGFLPAEYSVTEDGMERTVSATANTPGADVRVVIISSVSYKSAGEVNFDTLECFNDKRSIGGTWFARFAQYGQSKLMNILFAMELQRRFDNEGVPIIVSSLHPGGVDTEGAEANAPYVIKILIRLLAMSPLEGAYTSLFAATSAEVVAQPHKYKGKYLERCQVVTPTTKDASDPVLARKLWEATEKVVAET